MEPTQEITKALININSKVLEKVYDDTLSPAAKKVGLALETALGLGNTVLLPIKLLNEKTQLLFKRHMNSYAEKLKDIPEERLIQAPPEIAVPILDKLTYTQNEDLAELYINLLTSASSDLTIHKAHIAFVNIISNLTPDEIKIMSFIHEIGRLPTLTSKIFDTAGEELIIKKERMTGIEVSQNLIFKDNLVVYFNNLNGLGLLEHHSDNDSETFMYDEVFKVHEKFVREWTKDFLEIDDRRSKNDSLYSDNIYQIRTEKGYFNLTGYGYKFLEACRSADS
jgi:hypothetical protein